MELIALLSLAKHGCCERMVEISSFQLAKDLKTSQQTASRRIKELESEGYISREILPKGQKVRIAPKGIAMLRQVYSDLNKVFEMAKPSVYSISGEVTSGIGEGRYYMNIPGYKSQFVQKLGFEPYPGTLNLRLKSSEDVKLKQALQDFEGIVIEGFAYNNRTFGPAKCFRATIEGVEGAVVIPARSHYGFNSLEVIAPRKIRDAAKLKDGDVVIVRVEVLR
ncbi:MAG: DUF120 domain-containing protein [Methanobacteriota archaeon]